MTSGWLSCATDTRCVTCPTAIHRLTRHSFALARCESLARSQVYSLLVRATRAVRLVLRAGPLCSALFYKCYTLFYLLSLLAHSHMNPATSKRMRLTLTAAHVPSLTPLRIALVPGAPHCRTCALAHTSTNRARARSTSLPHMCPRSHLNESRSYQEHLTAASKSVTERQDEIGERIRVVERNAAARANRVGKLAQFMQKAEDRLTDVAALHSDVLRMNDMIHCAL
jgi:hypothetical protein